MGVVSGLVIATYFITLHIDVVTGVIVHLTAMSISVPYFVKSKAWDVVMMMMFRIEADHEVGICECFDR